MSTPTIQIRLHLARFVILGLILLNTLVAPRALQPTALNVRATDRIAAEFPVTPPSLASDTVTISRTATLSPVALYYHVYVPLLKANSPAIYWGAYISPNIYGLTILPQRYTRRLHSAVGDRGQKLGASVLFAARLGNEWELAVFVKWATERQSARRLHQGLTTRAGYLHAE